MNSVEISSQRKRTSLTTRRKLKFVANHLSANAVKVTILMICMNKVLNYRYVICLTEENPIDKNSKMVHAKSIIEAPVAT